MKLELDRSDESWNERRKNTISLYKSAWEVKTRGMPSRTLSPAAISQPNVAFIFQLLLSSILIASKQSIRTNDWRAYRVVTSASCAYKRDDPAIWRGELKYPNVSVSMGLNSPPASSVCWLGAISYSVSKSRVFCVGSKHFRRNGIIVPQSRVLLVLKNCFHWHCKSGSLFHSMNDATQGERNTDKEELTTTPTTTKKRERQ